MSDSWLALLLLPVLALLLWSLIDKRLISEPSWPPPF